MSQHKWWWSIWRTANTNAFIIYEKMYKAEKKLYVGMNFAG